MILSPAAIVQGHRLYRCEPMEALITKQFCDWSRKLVRGDRTEPATQGTPRIHNRSPVGAGLTLASGAIARDIRAERARVCSECPGVLALARARLQRQGVTP